MQRSSIWEECGTAVWMLRTRGWVIGLIYSEHCTANSTRSRWVHYLLTVLMVGRPNTGNSVAFSLCRMLRLGWYSAFADLTTSRMRSSAYTGCECPNGLCTRSQCRLTGHCMMMPLSTFGSLHQSLTYKPDKDFAPPLLTIYVFLLSDYLLWDVVPSLLLACVFGTLFLRMSLQHLLYSLSENV